MIARILSFAVTSSAAAALIGGALTLAPISQAAPSGDTSPPCVVDGTCVRLIPKAPQYLPLTPTSTAQDAPLVPASTTQ
jgi:hypothetical protein